MRQRIFCLVLILALTIPAAGWAKGAEADPWGNDLQMQPSTGYETEGNAIEGPTARTTAAAKSRTTAASLFHWLATWLRVQLPGI